MNGRLNTFVDAYRRHRHVAAYVVVTLSFGVLVWALAPYIRKAEVNVPVVEHTATSTPTNASSTFSTYHLPLSAPVRLVIPKLSINAEFEEMGLEPDGTIGVPKGYDTVGWYNLSAVPGEIGPAVILGHVDSVKGPAVFFSLGQLVPGDTFRIEREDGSEAVFMVDTLERNTQDNFPTEKVYGPIGYAGIRLITCSGVYDHKTRRYSKNLVVYGHLVEPEKQ